MTTQTNRVKLLYRAKDVIVNLEGELKVEMTQARDRLCTASEWIRHDEMYQNHLEKAMGKIAG